MALSADDRLLGEKVHNYCSSSEDEGEDDDGSGSEGEEKAASGPGLPAPEINPYDGRCTNTGPKGVITDWRKFKQLENERREEAELEKMELMKKLTLTCRSHLDDEDEKKKDDDFLQQLEELEDDFIKEYRLRRIEEMRKAFDSLPVFGAVYDLRGDQFIDAIDKENHNVVVIIHVYEEIQACEAMNGCLICLAQEYKGVKFCKIRASDAKLSLSFASKGVPALLIYKAGEMIGNFIRLSDDLGTDFFAADVEAFLIERGLLPDKSLKDKMVAPQQDDSDSDFDVD